MVLVGYVHQVRLVAELDRISFALWVRPNARRLNCETCDGQTVKPKKKVSMAIHFESIDTFFCCGSF
jgi:hypothetical protein